MVGVKESISRATHQNVSLLFVHEAFLFPAGDDLRQNVSRCSEGLSIAIKGLAL